MDKNNLKKAIKPLIKECLTEVLVEEGLISIIKENSHLSSKKQSFIENKPIIRQMKKESVANQATAIQEIKKKVSTPSFDPFSGTEILKEDSRAMQSQQGVDITSLFESNVDSWNEQLRILEGRK